MSSERTAQHERVTSRQAFWLGAACFLVGVLAARGTFNSVFNFPLVFSAICVVLGALGLWPDRRLRGAGLRWFVLVLGASAAVVGWRYQGDLVRERVQQQEVALERSLVGQRVPKPLDLTPLSGTAAEWNEAADFATTATIVAFWARWCSPCWKEMPLLQALYEELAPAGLEALAITRFDDPQDEAARRQDSAKAAKWLANNSIGFPAAITDSQELYQAFGARSVPTTVLVDANGVVVDVALDLDGSIELMKRARDMVEEL
ncbi:MAG: TlpA disulfide reductase family protein [Acidobacteriota bacterium]